MIKLIKIFKEKEIPVLPLKANTLIEKYQIPEGIELGKKLKAIMHRPIINKINTKGITKRLLNKKKLGNW